MLNSVFAMILLLSVFSTQAESSQDGRGIGIYIDQDMFVPLSNEDRDYTMGFALEFFWTKEKGLYPLDNLVKKASEWVGIEPDQNNIVYSFMLGVLAFTPDDLANPFPIYNDRPYSSLIYLSNKRVYTDNKDALAAEVLVGVIGTSIVRDVQTQFHEWYRHLSNESEPVEPQGWSHQISDGGELAMRLRLTNSHLHEQLSIPEKFDIASTMGLSFGFQSNLTVSLAMRAGKIKSPFWTLPFDPVNRGNFIPSNAKNELYIWTAIRAHLVLYDALLQGQFRRDSDVEFSSDEIERLVYDGAFGLTLGFKKSQLIFSVNAKSSDLKLSNRRQVWGGVNYIFNF